MSLVLQQQNSADPAGEWTAGNAAIAIRLDGTEGVCGSATDRDADMNINP